MCPRDRADAIADVIANTVAGRTAYMMAPISLALADIRAGKLRALGVTTMRDSGINITFHSKGTKGQRIPSISRTAARSTATNAITAMVDPLSSLDQPVAAEKAGGGPQRGVVDEPPVQPPPTSSLANQLNKCALERRNGGGGESGGCPPSNPTRTELTSSDGPRD